MSAFARFCFHLSYFLCTLFGHLVWCCDGLTDFNGRIWFSLAVRSCFLCLVPRVLTVSILRVCLCLLTFVAMVLIVAESPNASCRTDLPCSCGAWLCSCLVVHLCLRVRRFAEGDCRLPPFLRVCFSSVLLWWLRWNLNSQRVFRCFVLRRRSCQIHDRCGGAAFPLPS